MKKHLITAAFGGGMLSACHRGWVKKGTTIKKHVTCGNCKRTKLYRMKGKK